jgi:hypothetical protein
LTQRKTCFELWRSYPLKRHRKSGWPWTSAVQITIKEGYTGSAICRQLTGFMVCFSCKEPPSLRTYFYDRAVSSDWFEWDYMLAQCIKVGVWWNIYFIGFAETFCIQFSFCSIFLFYLSITQMLIVSKYLACHNPFQCLLPGLRLVKHAICEIIIV